MRHKVLWNLLVALFVSGLLLPGLGAPAQAGDFNPQPEPPAAEMKPELKQPIPEKGIDPGAEEKLVHPPAKKGIDPGNDKPHVRSPREKGISPGDDSDVVRPAEEEVTSPRDDEPVPKPPLQERDTGDGGIGSNTILR